MLARLKCCLLVSCGTLILIGCSPALPLLPDQNQIIRDRNKTIKETLGELQKQEQPQAVQVFVSDTDGVSVFGGETRSSAIRAAVQANSSSKLTQSSCVIYHMSALHIPPQDVACAEILTERRLKGQIAQLRSDYDDLTEAFVGTVEIGLINNEEIVFLREELHKLGELISARDIAVGDYKNVNDAFIADLRKRMDNIEGLIRAGIPQYE